MVEFQYFQYLRWNQRRIGAVFCLAKKAVMAMEAEANRSEGKERNRVNWKWVQFLEMVFGLKNPLDQQGRIPASQPSLSQVHWRECLSKISLNTDFSRYLPKE